MLLYIFVKYTVECAWCEVGRRRFQKAAATSRLWPALTYGLVRLLIGRTMVFLIEPFVRGHSEILAYALAVLPLRWLAWSIVAELIAIGKVRFPALLAGDRRSNLWRLTGTLLSSLADLPGLLAGIWMGLLWP